MRADDDEQSVEDRITAALEQQKPLLKEAISLAQQPPDQERLTRILKLLHAVRIYSERVGDIAGGLS